MKIDTHLIPVFTNENNRLLLQKQLVKDFASVNLNFKADFSLKTYELDEILLEVEEVLVHLLELGERKTLNLLYAVDVPENDFLKLTLQENIASELSKLIVKREALKIYFRLKYA